MGGRSPHDRTKGCSIEVSFERLKAHSISDTWHYRYYYDGWVHLLADIDGVRIITNDVCEFLQKVHSGLICIRGLVLD